MAEATRSQAAPRLCRASAEPLRGCAGQPCALRTRSAAECSTRIQYASTARFCDLGERVEVAEKGRLLTQAEKEKEKVVEAARSA